MAVEVNDLIKVFGLNVIEKAEEVRKIISYLPEEAGAYKNLSQPKRFSPRE